jgi:hypothetical protein
MKHASAQTLRQLGALLERLRALPGLVERKPGIFYRGSSAFLHFHEDPAGVFADAKLDGSSFERVKLSGATDAEELVRRASAALAGRGASAPASRRAAPGKGKPK